MGPTVGIGMQLSDLFKDQTAVKATKKLCDELVLVAKQGDHASVTNLLKDYQDHPQKYDRATFDVLVVNAFWRSCEQGHLECAKSLQPFSRQSAAAHSLYAACQNGDKEMVKFLIPFHDWSNNFIRKCTLFKAVEGGCLDVVKLILPHVPSKTQRTEALREACKANNQAIFDLLYPLSNPQSALKYMESRKTVTEEEKQMLKDAITAEQQKKVLSEAVGDSGGAKRKMKM